MTLERVRAFPKPEIAGGGGSYKHQLERLFSRPSRRGHCSGRRSPFLQTSGPSADRHLRTIEQEIDRLQRLRSHRPRCLRSADRKRRKRGCLPQFFVLAHLIC